MTNSSSLSKHTHEQHTFFARRKTHYKTSRLYIGRNQSSGTKKMKRKTTPKNSCHKKR